jgi:hypothetical protein
MNHAIVKLFLHFKFDTQSITWRAKQHFSSKLIIGSNNNFYIHSKSHNNDKIYSIVKFYSSVAALLLMSVESVVREL